MLMRTNTIDFHTVEQHQRAIDLRLVNWARWVRPGRQNWVSPMFAQYRSKAWQWERPTIADPLDTLDAMRLEKAVGMLPDKHRAAVRWAYVVQCGPSAPMRALGLSREGLMQYLRDGRQMLINNGK